MEVSKNLKFLLIWDPACDIAESIEKDKQLFKEYCESLQPDGYDIDYEELCTSDVRGYNDIVSRCNNKTRVFIWYTGRGQPLTDKAYDLSDRAPCLLGNKIYIQQHTLLAKLPTHLTLRAIIFDTCDKKPHPDCKPHIAVDVKNNFSTVFDFKGTLLFASAYSNRSEYYRSSEGSTFAIQFLKGFDRTYHNTLYHLCIGRVDSSDHTVYEKYIKDEEPIQKLAASP
jgi:hypothetical protein